MESEKFNLVFKGEVLPKQDVQEVKQNIASLFKLPMATVDKLFSGQSIVLKKGLDLTAANRYRVAIKKAGARVNLVKASIVAPSPQVNTANAAKAVASVAEVDSKAGDAKPIDANAISTQPETEDEKPAFELLAAGSDLLREDERTTAKWVPLQIDLSHLSLKDSEGNLIEKDEIDTPEKVEVADIDADILPVGSDLLPEAERKLDQPVEVAELSLDIAPVGAILAQAKPQTPPPPINVEHIQLAE